MARQDTLFYFVAHELSSHVRIYDRGGGEGALYTLRQSGEARKAELNQQVHGKLEGEEKHNPYDHEQREMSCIENGDLQGLRMAWEEQFSGSYGTTSRDPARNGRNLTTIVVAFATRAAIRGGVLPELAMSLGDVYMQKIDVIPNLFELGNLVKAAEYELAELVIHAKERSVRGGIRRGGYAPFGLQRLYFQPSAFKADRA